MFFKRPAYYLGLMGKEKKMKKFKVSADNIEYLLTKEIEADSVEEAKERYYEMCADGMVEVNDNEITNVQVEEIK